MTKFYVLSNALKRSAIRVKSIREYNEVNLFLGKEKLTEPFEMEVDEGKKFYDWIDFQDTSNHLISNKFYDLLKSNSISGWQAFEVDIKSIELVYHGFQVLGKSGKLIKPKEKGFYTGMKFDIDSWDGSDIFSPEGTTFTICTQKVVNIIKKNKLTNIDYESVDEIELYSIGK